ncbi:MAG: hypothetical protein BMS9Abin29_0490 [Gemmatimonadota bacterium]|nr:MAG: hypothetical protein BMS9Abin29_0490 [Gemmatimonadota bacterium]
MSADLQDWQPFDPGAGAVPEAIGVLASGGGDPQVIALLRMPGVDSRWGAEAAVGIARAWGESGDAVLLSDLDLREPKVHEVLGHENGQGVSDILLYGVSVQHAAFASEMGSFLVATAGTPVVDPEAVLAHPRWEAVTRGLRDSGVSVLLHIPSDMPGASSLLSRADHLVVFAADASEAEGVDGAIAVLGPTGKETAPTLEVDEPVEAVDVGDKISDAVIEAVTDEHDGALDEAVEMPEISGEEVPKPLVDADSQDEPPAEEPAVVEEAVPEATDDGAGEFALDEPAKPGDEAEMAGGGFSLDGLDGGQYSHAGDIPDEDEESSALDVADSDDTAPEEADGALVEGLEPDGDVFEVERSSLADGVVAPPDSTMMSGIEHGAGVAEEAPSVQDSEAEDVGIADAATELMPVSEAYDAVETGEDTEQGDGELQIQPERKMSGLDELERRRKWQERRRILLTTVVAIVVLGGGGYGLAILGIVDVPGITPANRLSGAIPAPVQLVGEQPTTPIVTHSLLINAYRTPERPEGMVVALEERLPGTLFFYTPLELDGRVQYVLFAGPAYSAVQADSLRSLLAVVLDRQNPNDWLVRATSYGFFLGEFDDAAGGDARIEELAALSIPAYALDVDYADGRTAVRVYAGAFTDEFDAQPLAAAMSESGVSDVPLIERRGRLPE